MKIGNGLKPLFPQKAPSSKLHPPLPFYGVVSVFPEGHFIMTPPPLPPHLGYFSETPTPVHIRPSPFPPQLSTEE